MKLEEVFANIPILEAERTVLRRFRLSDADDMFEYSSDEMVTRYISYHHHHISDSMEKLQMLEAKYEAGECMVWGIEHRNDHKIIGACAFTMWNLEQRTAEIGYTLNRKYWGKGHAKEAVNKLFEFGFQAMDLNRIEARCWVENTGSARVMEACKMQFEGILREQLLNKGVHRDVKMYSILRKEYFEDKVQRLIQSCAKVKLPGPVLF